MTKLTTIVVMITLAMLTKVAEAQSTTRGAQRSAAPSAIKGAESGSKPDTSTQAPSPESSPSNFESNFAGTVLDAASDPDDHVRCFLSVKQLMDLRPVPSVTKLTEADQSRVLTSVVQAIDAANEKELTRDQKAKFMSILAGDLDGKLVGKTPGEALATIMNIMYEITNQNTGLYESAVDPKLLVGELGKVGASQTIQDKATSESKNWFKANDQRSTLDALASVLATDSPDVAKKVAGASGGPSTNTQVNSVVASSARTAISKFVQPDDIGCAYQILSWNQSRLLFGRSVANDFISLQITVRNLNPKEEFIIHNAMLSVDTDIHGSIGRYFEGADKIAVEAYNNAGESLTRRGIVGNSISAASTLLSTLQPIVNVMNFSNAVAAFNGGVPKGWSVLSPDHQKEQLLLIANNGFSATDSFKTVIPKSSTATFYTWLPVKPFLQGWWVQACAQDIASVSPTRIDPQNPSGPLAPPPQVGVDLVRARQVCQNSPAAQWNVVPFQKWSSISDQLFRDLSLAVVAGIHVLEDNKNKSLVTDLKCPNNTRGEVDLSQASSDGTLNCDVSGENLDKVAKLRLENAANLVDPARPDGTVTVSGDNTSAKVAFRVSDLAAAPGGTYDVYAVGKDGSETATGQKLHLNKTDVQLTDIKPSSVDLASPPNNITISGYNIDKLVKACFSQSTATEGQSVVIKKDTNTQATIEISSLKLAAGSWTIYLDDCTKSPTSSGKVLTVAGTPKPTIDSFAPTSAQVGATVIIKGSNLTGASEVRFGNVGAHPDATTDQQITVRVPSGAISGSISVTTPGGNATSSTNFKVVIPKAKAPAHSTPPTSKPK